MRLAKKCAHLIEAGNEHIGRTVAVLIILMVLVQFAVVVMRYIFGVGSILMQEAIIYMHATVFMAASGYALLHDAYVRIDILYAAMSPSGQAIVNLVGVLLLLFPTCILILWTSWHYVLKSWQVLEGSPDGAGIPAVYLLKTLIIAFALVVLAQGLALAIRSTTTLTKHRRQCQ